MDKALIKKMAEAGVDPNVIVRLLLDDEPETVPEPEPAKEEPKTEPAKEEPKPLPGTDAILAAIEKLTGAVQAANIRNFGTEPKTETVDDILASVVMPKGGK